jgi:hypothetical protein
MLIAFFGGHCDVRDLSPADQDTYTSKRLLGGIEYQIGVSPSTSRKVRQQSVEGDDAILAGELFGGPP